MTLQLYLLRQLMISVGFALAGLTFLVLPAVTVQAVHKLEGAGLEAVLRYVPLVVVELVPYLAPIAFLLGVVATFGRLAADNEWTAMAMAGVHPVRVLLPGLVLAALGGLGTYALLSSVSPEWKFAARSFLRNSQVDVLKTLGQGRTQFSVGSFFVDAARRSDDGRVFHEVIMGIPITGDDEEDAADEAPEALVVVADSIKIDFPEETGWMVVYFSNARSLRDDQEIFIERPYLRLKIDDLISVGRKSRVEPKYLTSAEMRERLQGLTPDERESYRYELHRRAALSVTYVLFLLLGAATGLTLRSGTQLGAMTGALGFAFLYYVLSMRLGKELAGIGAIPPEVAAWTTNALYGVLGAWMARRVLWR